MNFEIIKKSSRSFWLVARRPLLWLLFLSLPVASLALLYFETACGDTRTFINKAITFAYAAPYVSDQRGTCQVKYETYELAGSFIQKPVQGNKEQSQSFPGYEIYEYFYPANPEKNNEQRKKLYSFNKNGSVEVYGNTVVEGDRVQLFNEFDNGNIGIASQGTSAGKKVNTRHFVQLEPRSTDVRMNGSANINYSWNPYDESGLGPSVFFNPNSSKMEMEKSFELSDTKRDTIVRTSLLSDEAEYFWKEYLDEGANLAYVNTGTGDIIATKTPTTAPSLQHATAFFFKNPVFYITDMGNRRVVAYNKEYGNFITLGKHDWNWLLAGITVDEENMMYMTDTAMDTIIKTKISGEGWEESYRDIDNYQSRLFLDGSENYTVDKVYGSYAKDVAVNDCGYTSHEVIATSSAGTMSVNPETGRPEIMGTEECAFGNSCYTFNGKEHLELKDNAAWNFGDDFFTIDLWAKFGSWQKNVALVSHPDAYLFEWLPSAANHNSSILQFAFVNSDRDANGQYTYQHFQEHWAPEELDTWYHLSIVRDLIDGQDSLVMYVDGKMLGEPLPITGELLDGTSGFQVGGYLNRKEMVGQIDNVRVARGDNNWEIDYSYRYEFMDPKGIILVDDYLYVVDSGHGRIVKMSKDFREWWTFGEMGSGEYQFKNPTDIYYFDGEFYITDTGNGRVIKTDMAEMVYYLKGESGGSWEVMYESDSPGLWGVLKDEENLLISDEYNGHIIKNGEAVGSKNPWNGLFKFVNPVDLQSAPLGHYMILDGISNYDFSTHVGDRAMDMYGTSQKEGINTRFNTGGLIAREKVRSQGVIAKLNYEDWYRWIGDELGPEVAHCPIKDNEGGPLSSSECTVWAGGGAGIDCRNIANAPPSECENQWDWYEVWPTCEYYVPDYFVVPVCDQITWCNDDTSYCADNGYCGSDGSEWDGYPPAPTPGVTYSICCLDESNFTPDGTHEGDEECGCSDYHNECYSFCTVMEKDCWEGWAVDFEFVEDGPPDYAAAFEENTYESDGTCKPAHGEDYEEGKPKP